MVCLTCRKQIPEHSHYCLSGGNSATAPQQTPLAASIHLSFLPFRSPELMPCEDLWQLAKALVAANRVYQAVQEHAERAVAWLAALSPYERLLNTGLFGRQFHWLST